MWEDIFQVYRKFKDSKPELIASDMSLDNASMFMVAWFEQNYNDIETSLIIARQPMGYKSKTAEVCNDV